MEEKTLFEATVVFPVRGGKVLLARKLRKIGAGCWNGYGGGVEAGDASIEATALREFTEESGLACSAADLSKVAVCYFSNTKSDGTKFVAKVHVYLLSSWTGTPEATEEMGEPTFFPINALPLDEMMPADAAWLPRAILGETMIVRASYGPFQKELLASVEILPVPKEELR
jgi:8-oxo-dGTP diphosphatase